MRRAARLPSDFGIDPETQNLCDGSWKCPSVRRMLGYNSPERRVERALIRKLLSSPDAVEVYLGAEDLVRVLGRGWRDVPVVLKKVSWLVNESGVSVSVRRSVTGSIIARVIL